MLSSGSDEPGSSGSGDEPAGSEPAFTTPETEAQLMGDRSVASMWAVERQGGRADDPAGKRQKTDPEAVEACPTTLTVLQRQVLNRLVDRLDAKHTSVVITNPLVKDNPIVYVTEPWQDMCGFTSEEAIGRNPRVTQRLGSQTDKHAIHSISHALRDERACKVLVLNFRGGLEEQPFWNMLSINPVMHRGQLQLYMANLQDYSYSIRKMVSLTPSQFCRSADFHQQQRRVGDIRLETLARPTVYEADPAAPLVCAPRAAAPPVAAIKRLGWDRLTYEPEHCTNVIVDALQRLDAQYELTETRGADGDQFVVHARVNNVALRVVVTDDAQPGAYKIMCTRVSGETFAYHDIFRRLRDMLSDDDFASWRDTMPRLTKAPQREPAAAAASEPASESLATTR